MITTTAGSGLLSVSLSGDGTVVGYALNRELYLNGHPFTQLKLSKVAPSGSIFQSQLFSYTVTLTNTGPSAASNVILTDTLGSIAGAKAAPGWLFNGFALSPPTVGSCSTVTGTPLVCTFANLPARTTVQLSVGISPTTYGTLTNTASVSTNTPLRVPTGNASVTVNVLPLPVAAVSLTLNGPTTGIALQPNTFIANVIPITASVPLTYTWTATNQADRTFTSTVFSDSETYTWNPGGVQLVTVTVTNAALNVVSATQTITISNPAPVLSSTFPMMALVNSPDLTLVLTGTGFVANSSVLWNGAPLATTFVVSGSLTAVVPANDLTATGNYTVAVFSPGPGGGLSNALNFLVEYPSPTLSSLQPNTAALGGPPVTLTVNGSNFVNGASLFFGSQVSLTTVFGSANLLTATIPASYLALPSGQVPVTVTNPSPSVGPSNALQFTLTDPTLSVTLDNPSIDVGQTTMLTATISDVQAADRTITLTSSDSSIGSVPATITLPAGTTSVTATVQGGVAGFAQITGTLPANIGGQSGSATLTVNNLTPTISQASPVTSTAGGPAFTLTLTGSNFVNGAKLFWGAQPGLTLVGNGATVTTSVPASYIATPGPVVLNALNPAPSDGASGSFTYNVISPTISLAPSELDLSVLGTGTFTATISAVQAANRSIAITPTTGLLLSPPSSITLLAGTTAITFNVTGGRSGGTGFITATLPASLGGLFDTSAITVSNTTPTISLITPSTVTVGTQAVLDVTGSGFVSTSKVRWNGNNNSANVPTGFVDSGHLTATVDATLFPTVGDYPVTVFNPNPGGGTSNVFTVTAVNPSPLLSSMSPVTALVNSPTFNLSVTGSQFINGASSVLWNNQQLTTNFVDSSHLTANVPASDLLSPGDFPIVVSTTAPGGGVSGPLTFTVVTTQPVITKIAPITGTINTASFTLVVTGTGFVNPPATSADSVIQVNNSAVATSFVNSGELTATIVPSIDTPTIGIYTITVLNPQPPNGPDRLSNVVNFTVTNPLPLLVSMSPTTATAGDATFNLTLTGSQFTSRDSTVLWAGAPLATTFITPQTLTAVVDSSRVAAAGFFTVTVTTAAPGGGTATPPLTFTVNNKAPTLATLSPVSKTLGASNSNFTLTVDGSDFVSGAKILWSSGAITTQLGTTVVNGTQVTGVVTNTLYQTSAGVYTVTVLNPSPPVGGILSTNALTFTGDNPQPVISAIGPKTSVAGTGPVTIFTTGTGSTFENGAKGLWNGVIKTSSVTDANHLQMTTTDADMSVPGVYTVAVQNLDPSLGLSASFLYTVTAPTVSLTATTPLTIAVGANGTITASISNIQTADRVISLTSSDPTVATVPPSVALTAGSSQVPFHVTGVNTGTVTITATLPSSLGGGVSNPVTVSVNFTGGFAPRFGPTRTLARWNQGPFGPGDGLLLAALVPTAWLPRGRAKRKRRRAAAGPP